MYEKQNFKDGQVLTADALNNIENGIADTEKALENKQPKGNYLTEHQKIKTINGESLVGEGDIQLSSNGGVVVNVKSFGATGDGITDDSKSIQDAIDWSRENGGIVYFPRATYLLVANNFIYGESTVALRVYENQTLFGDNATLLTAENALFRNTMSTHNADDATGYDGTANIRIEGITFDSARNDKITFLRTSHATNITIKNCVFKNCHTWHCIELNSTRRSRIIDSKFYDYLVPSSLGESIQLDYANNNGNLGITDGTVCTDIEISGCYFKVNNHPAIGNHAVGAHNHIKIFNNIFEGGAGSRGYIDFVAGAQEFDVYNNIFYASASGIVFASALPDICVYGNRFTRVTTPFQDGVSSFNNVVDGYFMSQGIQEGNKEILCTIEDFTDGFINKNTGAIETNTSFPRAIVSPMIALEEGATYELNSDITATTNDTGLRIRFYDTEDNFVLAVDAQKLDNAYATITANNSNHYIATKLTIVTKQACKMRINFLVSDYVTTAELTV